jgi:hypothetical protein
VFSLSKATIPGVEDCTHYDAALLAGTANKDAAALS